MHAIPALKRQLEDLNVDLQGAKRIAAPAVQGARMCMKVLISSAEVNCITGADGSILVELQQQSETQMKINKDYPGCQFQELVIHGASADLVMTGAVACFSRIFDDLGVVKGVDSDVPAGDCRVKILVPSRCVKAVIGPAGQAIVQIRQASGMHVHVEHEIVPPGPPTDASEQAVCLDGPLSGLQAAISMLASILALSGAEYWFQAWADMTYAGSDFPGLQLFKQNGKGLGKGKKGQDPMVAANAPVGVCIKLLVSQLEAAQILGRGGNTIKEIASGNNCKMAMSGKTEFYPGTPSLQQLTIIGQSDAEVANAAMSALTIISSESVEKNISCGQSGVPPGHGRIRLVVPYLAAKAVIGKGGENIKQIRYQSELFVHVESSTIPPGAPTGTSEQVVCLSGPLQGVPVALSFIVAQVSAFRSEVWFTQWANHSHAGMVIPGLVLELDGKGHGKGKQKDVDPFAGYSLANVPVHVPPPAHVSSQPRVVAPPDRAGPPQPPAAVVPPPIASKQDMLSKLVEQAAAKKAAAEQALADAVAAEQALQEAAYGSSNSELSQLLAATQQQPDEDPMLLQQQLLEMQQLQDANGEIGGLDAALEGQLFGAQGAAAPMPNGSVLAIKLLLPPQEAQCLLGDDGSRLSDLQSLSGTNMRLSEGLYPGCGLHEVTVQGLTSEAVLVAIVQIMTVIEETLGLVSCGEALIEPGGSRLKMVMPSKGAAAIIGVGGATVKQIRQQCNVRVNVDMNTVPCSGGVYEQAVLLSGPSVQIQQALPIVLEQLSQLATEKSLNAWAAHSNAGVELPGFTLFAPKGEGKKGKSGVGKPAFGKPAFGKSAFGQSSPVTVAPPIFL